MIYGPLMFEHLSPLAVNDVAGISRKDVKNLLYLFESVKAESVSFWAWTYLPDVNPKWERSIVYSAELIMSASDQFSSAPWINGRRYPTQATAACVIFS